ncbi:MAG TPA: sensor domain-containing protein [Streptosporangiaceae bacterium]|nr:sensor domain-containing protein [Streptosporangiaceae bacterium]
MFLIRDLVSARTWLAMIHHLTGFFLGTMAFFVAVAGLAFGVGLIPLALAGLPVLGCTLRFTSGFAHVERARFGLLGVRIPTWPASARPGFRWGVVPRRQTLSNRATWLETGYALLRFPVSLAMMVISMVAWTVGLVMVSLPFYNRFLPGGGAHIGGAMLHGTAALAGVCAGGVLLLIAAAQVTRGLAVADSIVARYALGPPPDLVARIAELEISRERVVDAAEAERQRIERDLHDGAQQRLVALAMELGRAKAKFADDLDSARMLVDQAHAQAKEALTELRNLVRGVHPPVLTDRGLDAALSGLVALCPVPVDLHVDVPVRPKASIEAVAYFVVAEALTNIAKHSRASHAKVVVEGHGYPGTLTVMISDDGIGGASPAGAGLRGLADRAAGVDGTLTVESPSGGPTIIAVELPCG